MSTTINNDLIEQAPPRLIDRRDYKRIKADLLCAIVLPNGRRYPAMTRNLSLGGVFMECERSFAKGERVRVSLNLQLGSRLRKVEAEAEVVHGPTRVSVTASGLGVNFLELDDEARQALEQYIDTRPEL